MITSKLFSIECISGEAYRMVTEAELALLKSGATIFQRGEHLVRSATSPEKNCALHIVDRNWLLLVLNERIRFERYDRRVGKRVRVDCPSKVPELILANYGNWRFPSLRGIVFAPFLRQDGSIVVESGYDFQTRVLTSFNKEWSKIIGEPTHADAIEALRFLNEPVKDFPFTSKADLSVFFSAVLTSIQGILLPAKPLHAFSANAPGSGKSMLADVVAIIATGKRAAAISWGSVDEESEKRFGSMAISGEQIILLDNIERPLSGEFLCSYLTQETVGIRILGQSKIAKIPTSATVLATGNNFRAKGDLNRRILIGSLDAQTERPELRRFAWSPTEFALENREKLVHAALTILRAYAISTDKICSVPLGSFEGWSKQIRDALIWAGASDPCEVIEESRESDPELAVLSELLHLWWQVHGSCAVTVRAVLNHRDERPENLLLLQAIASLSGKSDSARALGNFVAKNLGRVCDNIKFVRCGISSGVAQWAVNIHEVSGPKGSKSTPDKKIEHYFLKDELSDLSHPTKQTKSICQ